MDKRFEDLKDKNYEPSEKIKGVYKKKAQVKAIKAKMGEKSSPVTGKDDKHMDIKGFKKSKFYKK